MEHHGTEIHVDENEARAGATPHIVRYVLIISLILAIAALSLIWITGALNTSDVHDSQAVERQAASEGGAGAP